MHTCLPEPFDLIAAEATPEAGPAQAPPLTTRLSKGEEPSLLAQFQPLPHVYQAQSCTPWCPLGYRWFRVQPDSVALRGEFEDFVRRDPQSGAVLAAVVFDHTFTRSDEALPLQVKYHLRLKYSPRNAPAKEKTELNPNNDLDWHTLSLFPCSSCRVLGSSTARRGHPG
ncbi:hypothetical protein ANANG_G00293180 [Anguilla anguilla]|uniref:Uncharacterized protein n=1 Tax=Anguilla anguilla TaxID=7936 RepID=A0A9D3RM13_ANGAN|nr:hypothetical protein ANANG_G00293180 [Anguilla anguilla]